MTIAQTDLASHIAASLMKRNEVSQQLFPNEALRLAEACREMSERFLRGGRLLAFGRGPYSTDAQHVSVEFVHPVIVGKQALPALDLSLAPETWLPALAGPNDIVMAFGPPEGDPSLHALLDKAAARGAFTFALPGTQGDYAIASPSPDPFIHQEMIEVLYHTLWETVHVFFEHREMDHDAGEAGFLYPFLNNTRQETTSIVKDVAASIVAKAQDDEKMREIAARTLGNTLAEAGHAIHQRITQGGKIIAFGNGGSATDANDFVFDCIMPPNGYQPIPALSLSMEPAIISAVANDIGSDTIFLRQLIAQATPADVVVVISTSGSSRNIVAALGEARKRGMLTVALLGYDGGEIVQKNLVDHAIVVHSDYIPRIQEIHASMYHTLREALEVLSND